MATLSPAPRQPAHETHCPGAGAFHEPAASPAGRRIPVWRRAKSSLITPIWSGITCARRARSHRCFFSAASRWTAFSCDRGGSAHGRRIAPSIPRTIASSKAGRSPPDRPRIAVLSPYVPVSALARRRGAHLSSAARGRVASTTSSSSPFRTARPTPITPSCRSSAPASCWSTRRAIASRAGPRWPRPKSMSSIRRPCDGPSPTCAANSASTWCRSSTLTWPAYGGDILVEHDVTFDLYRQVFRRRSLAGRPVESSALATLRAHRGAALHPRS